MLAVYTYFRSLVADRFTESRGATMVEYALLVALIAVVLIGAITALEGAIDGVFQEAETQLNNASGN